LAWLPRVIPILTIPIGQIQRFANTLGKVLLLHLGMAGADPPTQFRPFPPPCHTQLL
jgi:hypothetical protein